MQCTMRIIFISICVFFVSKSFYAQQFIVDTLKLNTVFRELANNPNTPKRQKAYFDAFPKNWTEYINLYRYDNDKKYDLTMYHWGHKQMEVFSNRLTSIKKEDYLNRLIGLATDAMYDADAPAYLKKTLHKFMNKDPQIFMKLLSKHSKDTQKSFWSFYWSAPYKSTKYEIQLEHLTKLFIDTYPEEVKIMTECCKEYNGKITILERMLKK